MCIFLGYSMGYKGIICFNIQTRKCIISRHVVFDARHVVFDESSFPSKLFKSQFMTASNSQEPQHSLPILVIIPIPQSQSSTRHVDHSVPLSNSIIPSYASYVIFGSNQSSSHLSGYVNDQHQNCTQGLDSSSTLSSYVHDS